MMKRSLRSGRPLVWAAMAAVIGLGWFYMVRMHSGMAAVGSMASPAATGLAALLATFIMCVVMMVAMMLPSIVPAVYDARCGFATGFSYAG